MANPYGALNDYQHWRRSVSEIEAHRFDPVTAPRFRVSAETRIATAGSCFAQHIARYLSASGFTHFVTEDGANLDGEERTRRNFGVFSARYGNIYTVAQLDQLYDEAFAWRTPKEAAWLRPDDRLVDPARQQIEPDGFADLEALLSDRERHLAAVRRMFSEAELFIFTLGLTEAWRSREDGSIFSSAPGVVAGSFDPELHEFVNFGVVETHARLRSFLVKLRALNPQMKVLLTVSPVPLMATYEDRSVVVSTTYSKSVLRVAADMAIQEFNWVDYFPSFEMITGSQAGGLYFEDDAREVKRIGVAHVMRSFMAHYTNWSDLAGSAALAASDYDSVNSSVICDEEALDASAR